MADIVSISKYNNETKYKAYTDKLNGDIQHKQNMINKLVEHLKIIEINTETMILVGDIYGVILADWAIGETKREYLKQQEANKVLRERFERVKNE